MIEGLVSALKNSLPVNVLTDERIRSFELQEGDLANGPSLAINNVGGTEINTLNGEHIINPTIVQVDSYAITRVLARELSEQVRTVLKDLFGTLSDGTVIQSIRPVAGSQTFFEQESAAYRVFQQYEVWADGISDTSPVEGSYIIDGGSIG